MCITLRPKELYIAAFYLTKRTCHLDEPYARPPYDACGLVHHFRRTTSKHYALREINDETAHPGARDLQTRWQHYISSNLCNYIVSILHTGARTPYSDGGRPQQAMVLTHVEPYSLGPGFHVTRLVVQGC